MDEGNTPAVEMYLKNGYSVVRRERDPIMPLRRRLLMKKALQQRPATPEAAPQAAGGGPTQEASVQESKVFVWEANEP